MKTYKELLESINIDEKSADFIRLSFSSTGDVKKVRKWMKDNLGGANQGFTGLDFSGKDVEFEGVDDADELISMLKNAGFKFKVGHRESVEEEVFTEEEIALFELDDEAFEAVVKKRSASDRKKDVKKRKKWLKTSGGKKSAKKSKKRADKVKKGSIKVDKKKAKLMKKVKKVYK
jgi:hypothetical protein